MTTKLARIDPADTEGFACKQDVAAELANLQARIGNLHTRLRAEQSRALLVILQGMDASGKDGAVRTLFGAFDPNAAHAWSFKAPTADELTHDFLWRCHARVPTHGEIAVFNRSHYEDVVTARVRGLVPEAEWRPRFAAINAFERTLVESGTAVVKLFLHISRDEQKRRLERRLETPGKQWKFDPGDLKERARWNDYMAAYDEAIERCSPVQAPWQIVPADRKWYRDLVIARALAGALAAIDPRYPDRSEALAGITVDA